MKTSRYEPSRIESKWQAFWEANRSFATSEDPAKPRRYILDRSPYPSDERLHVGDALGYIATDVLSRYLRAQGFAVLHPIGWDALALPAEEDSIRNGLHPRETTRRNIENVRRQIKALGFSYDWEREVDPTDPAYVKWTQWIFLQLFRRGLVYQAETCVNGYAEPGTVPGDEYLVRSRSEEGDQPLEELPVRQWMLRISAYADRLAADLDLVAFPSSTKRMQLAFVNRGDAESSGAGLPEPRHRPRDLAFSRPSYWGEPIPIYFPVECDGDPRRGEPCTIHYDQPLAVDESELPLLLPEIDDVRPGSNPAKCLAGAAEWRFFQRDGKWFARETSTMPPWAGSSWSHLRHTDPRNAVEPWNRQAADRWLPVDLYVDGAGPYDRDLLYSRFWHKVLFDAGHVGCPEPFARLVQPGLILGEVEFTCFLTRSGEAVPRRQVAFLEEGRFRHLVTGEELREERIAPEEVSSAKARHVLKDRPEVTVYDRTFRMSESRGNVVVLDEAIREHGADALRLFEMFLGPLEGSKSWDASGIRAQCRFLGRVWAMGHRELCQACPEDLLRLTHRTIRRVGEDIEALRMDAAVSALTFLSEALPKSGPIPRFCVETLVRLIHPFAPHLGEELWTVLGHAPSIQAEPWPAYDAELCLVLEIEVPVQVNGKVRAKLHIAPGLSEDEVRATALADAKVRQHLEGRTLAKVVWVQDRLLSLVAT